jgi:hypothetical protein
MIGLDYDGLTDGIQKGSTAARIRVAQNVIRIEAEKHRGFVVPFFYRRFSLGDKLTGSKVEMNFLHRQTDLDISRFNPEGKWTAVRHGTNFVAYFKNENDAVLFKLAVR